MPTTKRKTRSTSPSGGRTSPHERPIDPLDIDPGPADLTHAGPRAVDPAASPTTGTPPMPPRTRRLQPDADRDVGKRAEAADRVRERAAAAPHKGGPRPRSATPKKPS